MKLIDLSLAAAILGASSGLAYADDVDGLVNKLRAENRQRAAIEQVLREADTEASIQTTCAERLPYNPKVLNGWDAQATCLRQLKLKLLGGSERWGV